MPAAKTLLSLPHTPKIPFPKTRPLSSFTPPPLHAPQPSVHKTQAREMPKRTPRKRQRPGSRGGRSGVTPCPAGSLRPARRNQCRREVCSRRRQEAGRVQAEGAQGCRVAAIVLASGSAAGTFGLTGSRGALPMMCAAGNDPRGKILPIPP
jgi:hypothetical protein